MNASTNPRFPEPPIGHRDWYAHEALRALPRIILMVDKNPYSDTYGCFDREFWHYRTVDFPCGMNQEFCLPLALAYKHAYANNPYRGLARLKELVVASIEFAARWTHEDGSVDDYFPFERALGAHVFSTYAMTESYLELDLDRPDLVDFFRLRGQWLLDNNESGQLANHQAFAALALWNVYLVTGEEKFKEGSNRYRDITLSWQHDEGWFQEYEGADPGYHSCSIAFLSKLWLKSQDETLLEPLKKAVDFAALFMHPDGSYAGEYGSRNTYHFYPHGFEVMARFSETAGRIADTFLHRSMPERRRYYNDDNRMCAHYVYDWLHAWRDYHDERPGLLEDSRGPFEKWLPDAKIFVKKTPHYYAVCSLAKGGVLKMYDDEGPLHSDTGLIMETDEGDVLVSHLVDEEHNLAVEPAEGKFSGRVSGKLSKRKIQLSSPVKQIAFRGMNLTVGRYSADLVRRTLQKVLITGKPRTDARFSRELVFHDERVEVRDLIDLSDTEVNIARLSRGADATSIYVANSNNFQESTIFCEWEHLDRHIDEVNERRVVELPAKVIRAQRN